MLGWLGRKTAVVGTGQASADGGGVSNTGVIHGDVHVYPRPAARSAYLEQVRRIAPESLKDRDQELDELARFCTEPERGAYRWWRAEAWAGKSALMSWFVLHPPAGVRVVSFFVTARFAGQSDRIAFTDVVIEQLADLLGEPVPGHLTESTRDPHFLALLGETARACQQVGERLVLVVDGLDEDRGVIAGPDAYSIAAVLPARPPAGMRVIVAGRPNPPIPADVPHSHPLRKPGVIRPLGKSRHAEVVRADSERELKRLLQGTAAEQDLLGLVTAAGGGLSGRDLAELTGLPPWQIEDHLHAVSGRTFARRTSSWRPDLTPEVYVLGHEELQVAATGFLGEARLDGYRQRLHTWADQYREQGWPASTPEYLLRGYYRMLWATDDLSRMVAFGTDRARHDRMLDISGGDTAALAEVTTAQDAILAQDDPDLVGMARLAIHRDALTQRNAHIPAELPAVWATLGHPTRAEALARSITDDCEQARALTSLAPAIAASGDHDRARRLLEEAEIKVSHISNSYQRAGALWELAITVAGAGDPDHAENLVHGAPHYVAEALGDLAYEVAATGDHERARSLARRAEAQAHTLTDSYEQVGALAELVRALVAIGDHDHARRLVQQPESHATTDSYKQARMAKCLALIGEFDRAEALTHTITDLSDQVWALSEVAELATANGDHERAHILIRHAETRAQATDDLEDQASARYEIASALTATGKHDQAETLVRTITNPYLRAGALCGLASTLATVGNHSHARALAQEIETQVRTLTDELSQIRSLIRLASALDTSGNHDRAQALVMQAEVQAHTITDPGQQARVLSELAVAVSATRNQDKARVLLQRAEVLANTLTSSDLQALILSYIATTLAAIGDSDQARDLTQRAEALSHTITEPFWWVLTLVSLVSTWGDLGDYDHAEELARTITYPEYQAEALDELAYLVAMHGDQARARILAQQAEAQACITTDEDEKGELLCDIAATFAAIDDHDHAHDLTQQAEVLIRAITDPDWRDKAMAKLASVLVAAGNHVHAETLANTITDPQYQADALIALASKAESNRARPLIARALRQGSWTTSFDTLVNIEPSAALAVTEAFLQTDPR